jgi:hypothetical protein
MQEIFVVAVAEGIKQLKHEELYVFFGKINQSGVQHTHKVVIHVIKDKIKSTLVKIVIELCDRSTIPSIFYNLQRQACP